MAGKKDKVLASCRDGAGRTVVLMEETWREHILTGGGRASLEGREMMLMRVVEDPDLRFKGNYEGAEKLYKAELGPARWLAVVVEYHGLSGRVITAHPSSDKEPRGERI